MYMISEVIDNEETVLYREKGKNSVIIDIKHYRTGYSWEDGKYITVSVAKYSKETEAIKGDIYPIHVIDVDEATDVRIEIDSDVGIVEVPSNGTVVGVYGRTDFCNGNKVYCAKSVYRALSYDIEDKEVVEYNNFLSMNNNICSKVFDSVDSEAEDVESEGKADKAKVCVIKIHGSVDKFTLKDERDTPKVVAIDGNVNKLINADIAYLRGVVDVVSASKIVADSRMRKRNSVWDNKEIDFSVDDSANTRYIKAVAEAKAFKNMSKFIYYVRCVDGEYAGCERIVLAKSKNEAFRIAESYFGETGLTVQSMSNAGIAGDTQILEWGSEWYDKKLGDNELGRSEQEK